MMGRIRHTQRCFLGRLKGSGGFTLVEMLAALAVLALLTGMVAMGATVATRAYGAEQFASQSDVLAGEIENALAAEYRFATSENPELFVSAEGRFVLQKDDTQRELLNPGAYGNCKVNFTGDTTSLKPVKQDDGSYVTEGTYTISKKSGNDVSPREYSFYFKSYGDTRNGQAFGGINSPSGEGGESGGGGNGDADELNQARADLAALIEAAQAITQGNKTWEAFQQLQGAIGVAEGWRDNNDATEQELVDAKAALQQAIETFNNSASETEEVTLQSFVVTLNPSADDNTYTLGTTGVKASARATYSDNTFSESATWSSSDSSIVSVDGEGNLSFNAAGSATITATIGEDSRDITITVESSQQGGDEGMPAEKSSPTSTEISYAKGIWNGGTDSRWYQFTEGDKTYAILCRYDNGNPDYPNKETSLAYYDGHYYSTEQFNYTSWDGVDYYYAQTIRLDDSFRLSHLTDGAQHTYNGVKMRWVRQS